LNQGAHHSQSYPLPSLPLSSLPPFLPFLRHKIILREADIRNKRAVLAKGDRRLARPLLEDIGALLQVEGEGTRGEEGGGVEDGVEVVRGQERGVGGTGGGGGPGSVGGGGGRGDNKGVEHRSVPEGGKDSVGQEEEEEGQGAEEGEDDAQGPGSAGPPRGEAAGGTMVAKRTGRASRGGEGEGGREEGTVGGERGRVDVGFEVIVVVVGGVVVARGGEGGRGGGGRRKGGAVVVVAAAGIVVVAIAGVVEGDRARSSMGG